MAKKSKKKARPPASKSRYIGKLPAVVEMMIAGGMDLGQVCEGLLICRQTLWRWRNEHPELAAAIEAGRAKRADAAEDIMLALIEPHDEVTVEEEGVVIEGEDGKPVEAVKRKVKTNKGVVSERLLLKALEAYKPGKFGKKVDVAGTFTFAKLAKMALSEDDG